MLCLAALHCSMRVRIPPGGHQAVESRGFFLRAWPWAASLMRMRSNS
jgi:hypothetical protein